jgi:G3E family GTPase
MGYPPLMPRSSSPRPLVILAGFLGAGKTRFLRALVPALLQRGLRSRVILNDVENAEIDAATLRDLQAELAPLTGDCLCCESQDELLLALRDETAAAHDVVLLEVNGTTDTALLLEGLAEAPGLAHLSSPLQVTTIDAVKFERRGWMNAIERAQLGTSSHLRISKGDLVDEARMRDIAVSLTNAVPAAVWTDAEALADELAQLVSRGPAPSGQPADLHRRPPHRGGAEPQAHGGSPPPASSARGGHGHAFLSCQIGVPFAVDGAVFEAFLRALPAHIVRAKGVVIVRDPAGEKRSFQLAAGYAEISPCALQDPDELAPVAVFVGSGIDIPALQRAIALLAL